VKSGSARIVRRLWHEFQDITVPHRETISRTVNKFILTGRLLDTKNQMETSSADETFDENGATLEHSTKKTLKIISTNCHKTLKLKPFKTTVMHELQPHH
jgi:hypothetical protein